MGGAYPFPADPSGLVSFNDRRIQAGEIPAAGGVSTARDLARLYAACVSDQVAGARLLTPASVSDAVTPRSWGKQVYKPADDGDRGVVLFAEFLGLAEELAALRRPSRRRRSSWTRHVTAPLPPPVAGAYDLAFTDPPYTVAGAELFLSRAVSALASAAASTSLFAFGARRPRRNQPGPSRHFSNVLGHALPDPQLQRIRGGRHPRRHQPPVPPAHHPRTPTRPSLAPTPAPSTPPTAAWPRPPHTAAPTADKSSQWAPVNAFPPSPPRKPTPAQLPSHPLPPHAPDRPLSDPRNASSGAAFPVTGHGTSEIGSL